MNPYYTILLLAFIIFLAIFLIRYVNNAVDAEFRNLARSVDDAEYRRARLADADARLERLLPLPEDAPALTKPGALRGVATPMLLALGIILLWGGGSAATGEGRVWLYGGAAAIAAAAVAMLATLRKRRMARTARLLLYRADLRRLDGNRAGAAEDLERLVKLTPWDDSAWAELADDLAAAGRLKPALEAMDEAVRIDPGYDEYRQSQTSLALRSGEVRRAGEALRGWSNMDGAQQDDPRLTIYRAALQLAEGERNGAAETLRGIVEADVLEWLDGDNALSGVKALLPGRG